MFTQFFGSYLLNKQIISADNLIKAMEQKNTTRVKLGVLAINAGYMTAKQVDAVHRKQATVDKRIGDIAVEMGYLTEAQVEELLSSQKTGCLLLGQALVDMGCLTNEEFENVLKSYKSENGLSDKDFTAEDNSKASEVISSFYNLAGTAADNAEYYSEYVNILFKNLIRFVGDDFAPLASASLSDDDTAVFQNIGGGFEAVTSIAMGDNAAVEFASRYSEEELSENDEYTKDVISEFLNLNNGLFNVTISNLGGKELSLTPQTIGTAAQAGAVTGKFTLNIPVAFSFGIVIFSITSR